MAMNMLEKIEAVRKVQDYEVEIENKLEEIIKETYDSKCYSIDEWSIEDGHIATCYWYSCRGESDRDNVNIPIEWLAEGFDYKTAYEEMKRKAEERRKQEEAEEKRLEEQRKKAAEAAKARKEQELYFKLKAKYEKADVK